MHPHQKFAVEFRLLSGGVSPSTMEPELLEGYGLVTVAPGDGYAMPRSQKPLV